MEAQSILHLMEKEASYEGICRTNYPSQCRIIDNKSGFIHIEGESAIFDMNGVYIGTAESTIGSIRENCIDAVIETLTNYKKKIIANQDKKFSCKIIKFDFNNKIKKVSQR